MTELIGEEPQFYFDRDMERAELLELSNGTVAVYTRRCPGKPTANEDSAAIIPCGRGSAILLVADGVGGVAAGEQASRRAAQSLAKALRNLDGDESQLRTAILDGIEGANRDVLEQGVGAATTLALVEIGGREVRSYHVGDSMIVAVGGRGKLKLQTISHSPVGYGVESVLLDEAEALHHEQRHLVSNVIGSEKMRIEIGPTITLADRDTVLLASDGLFDNLVPDEIRHEMRIRPLATAAERLANRAFQRMTEKQDGQPSKPDDLTLILFRPRSKARR